MKVAKNMKLSKKPKSLANHKKKKAAEDKAEKVKNLLKTVTSLEQGSLEVPLKKEAKPKAVVHDVPLEPVKKNKGKGKKSTKVVDADEEVVEATSKPAKKAKKSKATEELNEVEDEQPTKVKKSKKLEQVKVEDKKKKSKNLENQKEATKKSSSKNKLDKKGKPKNSKSAKDLECLKDIDPEFYEFLQKNDKKLLEFNLLNSDDDDDDLSEEEQDTKKHNNNKKKANESDNEEEDNDDDEDEDKFHKPSDKLEVASDESDYEDEEDADKISADGSQKVTLNLLRQWQLQLEKPNVPIDIVRKVIQAFNSALASISSEEESQKAVTPFKVVGAAAFNGVVQLCVLHLQPAILRVLGLSPLSTTPLHKTKKWVKVRGCLRYYLSDLIRLIEQVSSSNILGVLLKHLHQVAGMVSSFSTLGKSILKRLITLWATGDETIRVLAFLCILKITRNQQVSMLNHVLKAMYLSYVRNSKFVSPNTLPGINFMRRSLVEMFALDLNVTYQHAFLYIRQLAIHLRNAVILKKKDSFQAVYNWQFVNSLRLWADLMGATANKPQLQPLIYPLVTIALGVIRLIPTAQYFPLRFHCIQALIGMAKETQTFVPVLPLILEVLRSNTFNKKHTNVSMRPQQFTCILRLNKAQLSENGFRDEVVEQVCGLLLDYLAHESCSLAFPDLVVPTVVGLKAYLKECRNANHSRKLKQLLDKIQENSRFMEQQRRKITFGLKDQAQIQAWESQLRNKGTPLSIYYNSWVKTHETKKRRQAAQSDTINDDYNLPSIKRRSENTKKGVPIRNEHGELELFPSDSEDDGPQIPGAFSDDEGQDNNQELEPPVKKVKKSKLKKDKKSSEKPATNVAVDNAPEEEDPDTQVDIVKDLDLDDW